MVTAREGATLSTLMENGCLATPPGIVTVAGTVATGLLLWRATTTPAGGAATVRLIRPSADVPPGHCVNPSDRESSCSGATIKVAVRTLPDAGMVAVSVSTV